MVTIKSNKLPVLKITGRSIDEREQNGEESYGSRTLSDTGCVPRSLAERLYTIGRWTEMKAGGHFAALEQPEALVQDIRAFFRSLRNS